jgi:hypothetical protein
MRLVVVAIAVSLTAQAGCGSPSSPETAGTPSGAAAGAATLDQLNQMAEFGHYLGWRVGIRSDGTWIFFVAGD